MGSRVRKAVGGALLLTSLFFPPLSLWGTALALAGSALTISGQRRSAKSKAKAAAQHVRGQTVTQRGAATGAVAVYGETIVGGAVAEFRTSNDDANKAYDAHLLIAHAFRRGGIEGLGGFFLDDQWIPYPGAWEGGLSTNARGAAHGGVPTGKYSPRNWGFRFSATAGDGAVAMRFGDGARTGGPPFLVDAFADWTAADQGLDVVWSEWLFKLRGSTKDLFGGGPPRVRAVLKGCRVYDPRKDSTATIAGAGGKGAGSHRLDDRSTWEWSDNPALCWADYAYEHSHLRFELRHPVWAAGADYGQGAVVRTLDAAGGSETWWRAKAAHESAAADRTAAATATAAARLDAARWNELPHYAPRDSTRVDWPSVATAADRCDALVPVPGGRTEKRWRCDCALPLGHGGDLHRANMTALLASMGGQALRIGDTWHVLAPGTATAGPTFGAASIGEYQLRSNLPASERANTVGGRFASRDHGWEVIDTPARRDRQAVERDGETALDIPGQAVTRNTQMQRLAALALKRQALQETFTGLLDWSGIQLQPDAGFTLDLPVFDAPKRFRAESITLMHSDAPVSVTAVEDEDDVYDDLPAADYHSVAADGAVTFASDAPFAPTAFSATGVDGAVLWKWTPPPLYAEVVLYTSATADWDDAAEAWRGRASEARVASTPGETRWGWARAVGANGRESARTPDDDVSSVSAAAVGAAAPIYEALADGACPPADRGEHGQLWIAPDGRVFEHRSVFAVPPPDQDGITVDGVDGVLFGGDGMTSMRFANSHAGGGAIRETAYVTNDHVGLGDALMDTVTGAYLNQTAYGLTTRKLVLRINPGTADFKPAIEGDLFVGLRFPGGATAGFDFDDDREPYVSSTVGTAEATALFAGASIDVDVRGVRKSKRCDPANPLNPWVRRPDLGVAGTTYRELALYKAQSRSVAAPAAPAVTWTFADGVFAVAAPAGWSQGPALPAWDEQTQFLWCSAALLSSAAASANGSPPVVCDDAGDLNVVFQRSAAAPSTPGDSKGESPGRLPTGWSDTVPAQADPPLPLWMSVGQRQVGAAKFKWSSPVRAEGQAGEDGSDGTTYQQVSIYRAVTRTANDDTPETPRNTTSSFDDGFTWSAPRYWSKTIPSSFDVHTQFLFCSTATLDSTATSAEWSDPVLCDDLPDLNTIYKRSATQPANPGRANKRTVSREPPTGWQDSTENVPDGSGAIWVSVGVRQAEASEFEWSDPTKLEGTTYLEVKIYRAVTRTANDDTPETPRNTTSSFNDGFTWSEPRNWSKTIPSSFDVHTQFLFCSTATLDSTSTAVEWSGPVLCDDLPDLNAIYKRSVAAPSNPGGADKRTVSREPPTGWRDSTENVPDGSGAIWVSVGVRQAEASEFEWSDPTKLEGVDPVELSHNVEAVADWPYDAGELASTLVTWTQGSRTLDAIRVKVDSRLSSGVPQCRMRLSGIGSSPEVRVDGTVRTGLYAAPWSSNFPCRHEIEVAGVVCTVLVRKGPAPVQVTTVDHPIVNFTRSQPVQSWPWTSATQRVTWTKGAVTKQVDVWASKARSSANIAIEYREVGSSSLGSVSSSNYSRSSEFSQRTLTVDGVATAIYALYLGSVL